MPDDHVLAIEGLQKGGRNLTGVCPGGVRRDVLAAISEWEPVGGDECLHRTEVGERRKNRHLDIGEVVARILQVPRQLLHERDGLEVVEVHLPVAGNQWYPARLSCRHASQPNTSSPGRRLPSRNSRLAPPPVEMWPNWPSVKPSARTAAAESPPPTTESPSTSVSAAATALVDRKSTRLNSSHVRISYAVF